MSAKQELPSVNIDASILTAVSTVFVVRDTRSARTANVEVRSWYVVCCKSARRCMNFILLFAKTL